MKSLFKRVSYKENEKQVSQSKSSNDNEAKHASLGGKSALSSAIGTKSCWLNQNLSLSLFSFKLLILLCFEVLVQCVRYSMLSGAPLWCSVCLTFCEVLKGLMPPEKMTPNSQLMNGLAGYLLLSFLVSIFLATFYFASDWK